MEPINNWQESYKTKKIHTELIEDKSPLQEEDNTYKQKATEYFADVICEFFNEMSGQELFDCFSTAAKQNLEFVSKEYNCAVDLVNLINGSRYGQK